MRVATLACKLKNNPEVLTTLKKDGKWTLVEAALVEYQVTHHRQPTYDFWTTPPQPYSFLSNLAIAPFVICVCRKESVA